MVSGILTQLEKIAYWSQKKYMRRRKTSELVGRFSAFFHPQDKSKQIIALHQIRFQKAMGKKIVLVTGCFDLLHQEHKKFLRKAKKQGDILVVGLESDQRIKKIKGSGRPINSWSRRSQNLLRLNEVGFILELPANFDESKKRFSFLRLIEPEIIAISSHDPLEKQKRKDCQKINCRLKTVHQYNPKISTSQILTPQYFS